MFPGWLLVDDQPVSGQVRVESHAGARFKGCQVEGN